MPLWRAQAYLQEMSGALLSTEYERAYQNGNAMVWPQDDYLPPDSSYPTSHPRDNSAKNGLLNLVNAVIFTTTPKSNYPVCPWGLPLLKSQTRTCHPSRESKNSKALQIHRILRKYPKEIYEISEHFVVVTFKFAEPLSDDQGVCQQSGTKGSIEGGMKSGTIGGTKTYPELSFSLEQIVNLIIANPSISIAEIAAQTKKAKSGVQKQVKRLQEMGVIRRVGPKKGGHWEIITE